MTLDLDCRTVMKAVVAIELDHVVGLVERDAARACERARRSQLAKLRIRIRKRPSLGTRAIERINTGNTGPKKHDERVCDWRNEESPEIALEAVGSFTSAQAKLGRLAKRAR